MEESRWKIWSTILDTDVIYVNNNVEKMFWAQQSFGITTHYHKSLHAVILFCKRTIAVTSINHYLIMKTIFTQKRPFDGLVSWISFIFLWTNNINMNLHLEMTDILRFWKLHGSDQSDFHINTLNSVFFNWCFLFICTIRLKTNQ